MVEQRGIQLQQGVWIDRDWINSAGLRGRLRILVRPGEIRIVAEPSPTGPPQNADAWNVFRSLGNNAPRGQLRDAAVEHDRYLYGQES